MRRQLLALAVVLLLGALGLALLSLVGSGDGDDPSGGPTTSTDPTPGDPAPTGGGDGKPTSDGGTPQAPSSGKVVVVVRADDGEAVARAEVSIVAGEPGGAPVRLEDLAQGEDPLAWVENHGQTLFADARGRVELPGFVGSAYVVARKDGEVGSTEVLAGDPEARVRLAIRPAFPLVVRVVDARQTPVEGIEVVLAERRPWGSAELHRVSTRRPDGLARFGDIRWRFGHSPRGEPRVRVALPLGKPLEETLDLAAPSTRPLRLVLPPTGRVEFDVFGPGGAPVEDGTAHVRLVPRDAVDGDGGSADTALHALHLPVRGGRAVAEYVGLDLELVAEVVDDATGNTLPPHSFRGPTRRGESVSRRLAPGGLQPDLTGMLLRPGGQPLVGARVYGQIIARGGVAGDWSLVGPGLTATCDEDGMFRFRPGMEAEYMRGQSLVIAREVKVIGGTTEIEQTAVVPLPETFGRAAHDVGEIEISVEALLASGQVLDGNRQPVANANVTVLLERDGRWVRASQLDTPTDSRGRFRLDGRLPHTRLRLRVATAGYLQDGIVPFTPGSRDLLLRLVRTGALRGSIRAGAGLTTDAIQILVSGEATQGADGRGEISVQPDASGNFRCDGLRPGRATVRVRMHGSDQDLRRVDGLVIRSGTTCEDERIRLMDVASKMETHKLTIVGRDGSGIARAQVWFRPSGSLVPWRRLTASPSGTCSVPAVGGSLDVMVGSPGRRYATLYDVREDRRVVMRRAQESHVEVRLAGAVKLPQPPVFIRAQLIWLGPPGEPGDDAHPLDDPRNVSAVQTAFASKRSVTLPVWEPGEYRVQLWVARGEQGGSVTSLASRSRHLTITETQQRIGVDVSVRLEVLEQLVEAVGGE